MSAFSRMASWFKKESAAGGAIAQFVKGQPVFTPRQYDKLAQEAYIKNVIAYRCVAMIATACASVCWKLYKGDQQEVEQHDVLDLLKKPNPTRGQAYFIEEMITYLLLSGNSYIEKTTLFNSVPRELYALRPDRMRVVPGDKGLPISYEHEVNGVKTIYQVDPVSGLSPICHLMKPHPLNDWYGLAPVEAAAYSIDQHNAAALHNTSLLQNSASPSGALVFKGNINKDNLDALEEKLREKYTSPKKAGRPMVLGGDFDWKPIGLSPKDLDFNMGKIEVAREICTAFGVPHLLVIPGQATYNNITEAKLMFWDDTVIPLLYFLRDNFFSWLLASYGDKNNLYFECDLNDVSALAPRRLQNSDKVMREWSSGLLQRDEARMLLGYDKVGDKGGADYGGNPTQGAEPKVKSLTAPQIKALEDLRFVTDEIDRPEITFAITEIIASELDAIVRKYGKETAEELGERAAFQVTQEVTNFIKDSTGELVTHINGTTRRLVRTAIDEALQNREGFDDIQERITEIFKGKIADYRSRMIGVTESTRATGFAADAAMRQAGIEQKEWLAVMDSLTRDTHAALDGQKVAVGGWFFSPSGDRAQHPGGFATAGENINCRCAIAAVFDRKGNERTESQRRELWEQREMKRVDAEKQLVVISRKIFIMQGDAVLKRMGHIHQEPGVTG